MKNCLHIIPTLTLYYIIASIVSILFFQCRVVPLHGPTTDRRNGNDLFICVNVVYKIQVHTFESMVGIKVNLLLDTNTRYNYCIDMFIIFIFHTIESMIQPRAPLMLGAISPHLMSRDLSKFIQNLHTALVLAME